MYGEAYSVDDLEYFESSEMWLLSACACVLRETALHRQSLAIDSQPEPWPLSKYI